jgi:hypothetical protein
MTKLDDPTRLGHMLESARMAMQFIEGETRVSLETDKKLVLAQSRQSYRIFLGGRLSGCEIGLFMPILMSIWTFMADGDGGVAAVDCSVREGGGMKAGNWLEMLNAEASELELEISENVAILLGGAIV